MEVTQPPVSDGARGPGAPPTLRAHVVKMLSADILAGKYKPGDRLNESQIARELNISRIPVREALSQLQEQGLVQNRERRGMFVTNIGPEEVLQISSLRIVLETEALRLARMRMTPEIVARLERIAVEDTVRYEAIRLENSGPRERAGERFASILESAAAEATAE